MIYKPKKGRFKDNCMIYENGTFYLYSMYNKENSDEYRHVWLATSRDGVHFEDYGCVVEDFPNFIWAMKIYRGEYAFYMNSGSFEENGKQAVLKFWKSNDLINWEYRPELDVLSPELDNNKIRLDCMNVVKTGGKYYGYATGQYGFLESEDGEKWKALPSNISYEPFPPYNTALGGFEIADCIELGGKFYLFSGGFGHLGMDGYGVYIYESEKPEGPFKPCLPYYRINGTSHRWVNVWERVFEKDGKYLAHNYIYAGHTYDNGDVYLPPIKELSKDGEKLFLKWWDGNDAIVGETVAEKDRLSSESQKHNLTTTKADTCNISALLPICRDGAVIDFDITLSENSFTEYTKGGFFLSEGEKTGSAVVFDTAGKCEIMYIKDGEIQFTEDIISFGSNSLYYLESGKTYSVRVLTKGGMFETYVNGVYLQTFNNAHFAEIFSVPFTGFGTISLRSSSEITNIKIHKMTV